MALKLSRDLKQNVQKDIQENTSNSKTGFNIQCVPGKEYDLDEILAIRKRDNPDAPLFLKLISVDSATSKEILARIIRDVDLLAHENLMLPEVKEAIANTVTSTYETFGYVVGEELNPDRYEMVYEVINKKITRYLNAISEKFQLDYKIMPGTNLPDIIVKYNINEIFMGSDDFAAIVTDYYNRYASTMNAAFVEETEGALSMEGGEERVKKVSPTYSDYKECLLNNTPRRLTIVKDEAKDPECDCWEDLTEDNRNDGDMLEIGDYITQGELNSALNLTKDQILDHLCKLEEHLESQIKEIAGSNSDPNLDTISEIADKIKDINSGILEFNTKLDNINEKIERKPIRYEYDEDGGDFKYD